ncbi:hypothetical protein [Micromonospora sp. WMMD1082]|uniref:hypothetical protein n=1 Tax=Micromonospora sp. WMMD1082 TaxID=3016104 RepID=UPI002417C36A|nr:hypothetical protein [Micromonospora sp. WMMD1082]MDG4796176.1 hypothetical protein [Micromonospora sp. WMMD1082]
MLDVITQALAESAPEVGGLAITVLLVAVAAVIGRRQDVRQARRAQERRVQARRQRAGEWLVLAPPVDPWPNAQDDELVLNVLDVTAGVAR